jgi:predicted nucleic acid-binding protein
VKRVFVDTGAFFAHLIADDTVMARLGITDAIAFDRHFAEYGRFALLHCGP